MTLLKLFDVLSRDYLEKGGPFPFYLELGSACWKELLATEDGVGGDPSVLSILQSLDPDSSILLIDGLGVVTNPVVAQPDDIERLRDVLARVNVTSFRRVMACEARSYGGWAYNRLNIPAQKEIYLEEWTSPALRRYAERFAQMLVPNHKAAILSALESLPVLTDSEDAGLLTWWLDTWLDTTRSPTSGEAYSTKARVYSSVIDGWLQYQHSRSRGKRITPSQSRNIVQYLAWWATDKRRFGRFTAADLERFIQDCEAELANIIGADETHWKQHILNHLVHRAVLEQKPDAGLTDSSSPILGFVRDDFQHFLVASHVHRIRHDRDVAGRPLLLGVSLPEVRVRDRPRASDVLACHGGSDEGARRCERRLLALAAEGHERRERRRSRRPCADLGRPRVRPVGRVRPQHHRRDHGPDHDQRDADVEDSPPPPWRGEHAPGERPSACRLRRCSGRG